MGLSRMCKECRECPYKDDCQDKQMEKLAYLEPVINPVVNIEPRITINMGERGNGIINNNDIAKAILREINESIKRSSYN